MFISRNLLSASIAILSIVVMVTAFFPVFNTQKPATATDARNEFGMPVIS